MKSTNVSRFCGENPEKTRYVAQFKRMSARNAAFSAVRTAKTRRFARSSSWIELRIAFFRVFSAKTRYIRRFSSIFERFSRFLKDLYSFPHCLHGNLFDVNSFLKDLYSFSNCWLVRSIPGLFRLISPRPRGRGSRNHRFPLNSFWKSTKKVEKNWKKSEKVEKGGESFLQTES